MKGLQLEQHIRERIRDFDMPALLGLLAQQGYGESDIEYRSHRTLVHQSHLVHDIQFIHVPRRRVVITVNIGLLSAKSPLPAFLLQTMEQMDPLESERMERFLGYFDHELLRARFAGLYPERSDSLLPGWEEAAPCRLNLLRLTSPSTLHWLFSQLFPEAEVAVKREARSRPVAAQIPQLSASVLGGPTALGGFASVPTGGLEVSLFLNESRCAKGAPWMTEASHRLSQQVLPLLGKLALPLTVWLVLRDQSGPARLQQDSYLSYAPLVSAEEPHQHILLFRGEATHSAANATQQLSSMP